MVRCAGCYFVKRKCALACALTIAAALGGMLSAQELPYVPAAGASAGAPINLDTFGYGVPVAQAGVQPEPTNQTWLAPPGTPAPPVAAPAPYFTDPAWGAPVAGPCPTEAWHWQILPRSVIYHSYQAGMHEPRLGIIAESERNAGASFWDGTLGGRVGLFRYGTDDGIFPQGWEVDVEAAAMVRLTLDEIQDFETADYRYGLPITYGIDNWQFKFAAYHLSAHVGDELAIADPATLANRINYVRNSLVLGASYFPLPAVRLYGELEWGFHVDGGAEPWAVQFGTELSQPGPTGLHGTPFVAVNAYLREEVDWGGDICTQAGWLWRNETGQVARVGVHYFNGKSSQFQTFNQFEQQIGVGVWYDF